MLKTKKSRDDSFITILYTVLATRFNGLTVVTLSLICRLTISQIVCFSYNYLKKKLKV